MGSATTRQTYYLTLARVATAAITTRFYNDREKVSYRTQNLTETSKSRTLACAVGVMRGSLVLLAALANTFLSALALRDLASALVILHTGAGHI